MEVIQAGENFREALTVQVGTGSFKNKSALRRAVRPWRLALRQGEREQKEDKPRISRDEFLLNMALMGIPVEEVATLPVLAGESGDDVVEVTEGDDGR